MEVLYWMVILVAIANVANIIPLELKEGAKKLQGFFSKQFLLVVMVGVGIAMTDLGELIAANRMDLMSFAQISSRLGGGIMLILASIAFGIFF